MTQLHPATSSRRAGLEKDASAGRVPDTVHRRSHIHRISRTTRTIRLLDSKSGSSIPDLDGPEKARPAVRDGSLSGKLCDLVGAHSRSDPMELLHGPTRQSKPVAFVEFGTMKHYDPNKERSRAPMSEATYRLIEFPFRVQGRMQQPDIAGDLGIYQDRNEIITGKRGDPEASENICHPIGGAASFR